MKENSDHNEEVSATPSTGNVFADLELPDRDELPVKSNLATKIAEILEKSGMSRGEAAAVLGIPQPKVSMIQHGKLHSPWRNSASSLRYSGGMSRSS